MKSSAALLAKRRPSPSGRRATAPRRSHIQDVAERAGVAISTVSRVLNSSGYASKKTRRKVLAAVKTLGYRQNNVARSLRRKRSNLVGLLVPDISNQFYACVAKVIENQLSRAGFHLFLCNTEESEEVENAILDSMINNQVGGFVVIGSGEQINSRLLRSDVPTVMFDRSDAQIENAHIAFVKTDNYRGGTLATETLLARGCRRLAMIRTNHPTVPMDEREAAFLDTLRRHGLPRGSYDVYSVSISSQEAMLKVKEIFARHAYDGLFCAADILAIGAVRALRDLRQSIPDDVQIVGFDDIPLASFLTPSISTIASDLSRIGITLATAIVKLMRGQEVEKVSVLPVRYVERESTLKEMPCKNG
ncbi:MAG TPA: LacI family DNA-binding transcriptional regulator [Anaeromyxobacteraceae bacterium]|nr:LacI family DNA-binding transcriptional regulator [Anaeromyxobacteraceae bacterium]